MQLGTAVTLSVLAAVGTWSLPALGDEGVLERVQKSGVVRAGTRGSTPPFAELTEQGEFRGFSVDLLHEIGTLLGRHLDRAVRIEFQEVTPADRIRRIVEGELDIVCGITTPTWKREQLVDFSVPFFRDGTRVMVYREAASPATDVGRLKIGVVRNTTTSGIVKMALPVAELRMYSSMADAMDGLASGEVEGVANLGIVLLGLAKQARPRRSVVLLPRTRPLATETLACILPEDDSSWRDFINRSLISMLADIEHFRGRYDALYNQWFGREGQLFYPLDRDTRRYLRDLSIWVR